jgi:integrase
MVRPPGFGPFPEIQIRPEKSDNPNYPTITGNGLNEFREFLRIDLAQSMKTVKTHHMLVRKFLEETGKPPSEITEHDIRGYLSKLRGTRKAKTYNNMVGSLKPYFRDFLKRPDVVESFKFVKVISGMVEVPTTEELRRFFAALERDCDRAMFLFYATTGLRRNEGLSLRREDIDPLTRKVTASKAHENYSTKNAGISFYNDEAAEYLSRYLAQRTDKDERLFPVSEDYMRRHFKKACLRSGVRITPQKLRDWFCQTMGELGVPDRFVDAFCGRVPASVLARRYTDYRPDRLKAIYDKAALKVLDAA